MSVRAAAACAVVALVAACSSGDGGDDCDPIAGALVDRIEVAPASPTVTLGGTLALEATAFSCAGEINGIAFTWTSEDAAIATVSSAGVVQGVAVGGPVRIAAAAQGKQGASSITVGQVPVASVQVLPPTASIGVGRTAQLTARALDANGNELSGRPATWASGEPGIASVSPTGLVTGVAIGGPVTVSATIEGVSASSQIAVVLVPVASVTVAPGTSTIPSGGTLQLTATMRDDQGNVLAGRAASWTSSNENIAGVTPTTGLVTGRQTGGPVTITATSEGRSGTATVTVTVGAANRLSFVGPPSSVTAGAAMTPPIVVEVQDASGNRVLSDDGRPVTLAFRDNPGGATLGGTLTVNTVAGRATFSNITINRPGTGYSLLASREGLVSILSTSFDVTAGAATRVSFVVQPTDVVVGAAISPALEVQVLDAIGNRVTTGPGGTAAITLELATNAAGATLGGTTTVNAVAGLARFPNVTVDRIGTGYRVLASSAGLTGTNSATFAATAGAPTRVSFVVQPTDVVVGAAITPALEVQVLDAGGNRVTTSTAAITLELAPNPGNATLGGTTTVDAVAGLARFPNVTVDRAGTGYRVLASSAGLTGTNSATFAATALPATRLQFIGSPADGTAGVVLAPVQVEALDAGGSRADYSGPVTLTLQGGTAGATLGGTTTVNATNGLAVFSNLVVDLAGSGYVLTATSTPLTAATSSGFSVAAGPPSGLRFSVQPSDVDEGDALQPPVQIELRDTQGNLATGATGLVTIDVRRVQGANCASASGISFVGGGTRREVPPVGGVVTFNNAISVSADRTACLIAGYQGLSATSNRFDVEND